MDTEITSAGEVRYLCHLPDGSGVQAHSAGDHYPYSIAVLDKPGSDRCYEVSGPGIRGLRYYSDEMATRVARRLAVCIRNKDAWAFEVEQATKVADQRVFGVIDMAARLQRLAGHAEHRYSWMSQAARANYLLVLGISRSVVLPKLSVSISQATFADDLNLGDYNAVMES